MAVEADEGTTDIKDQVSGVESDRSSTLELTAEGFQWLLSSLRTDSQLRRLVNFRLKDADDKPIGEKIFGKGSVLANAQDVQLHYDAGSQTLIFSGEVGNETKTHKITKSGEKTNFEMQLYEMLNNPSKSVRFSQLLEMRSHEWIEESRPVTQILDNNAVYHLSRLSEEESSQDPVNVGDVIDGFGINRVSLLSTLASSKRDVESHFYWDRRDEEEKDVLYLLHESIDKKSRERSFVRYALKKETIPSDEKVEKELNQEYLSQMLAQRLSEKIEELASIEPRKSFDEMYKEYQQWIKAVTSNAANANGKREFLRQFFDIPLVELLSMQREKVMVNDDRVEKLSVYLRNQLLINRTHEALFQSWREKQESSAAIETVTSPIMLNELSPETQEILPTKTIKVHKKILFFTHTRGEDHKDTSIVSEIQREIIAESGLFDEHGKAKDELCTPVKVAKFIEHLSALEAFFSTEFRILRSSKDNLSTTWYGKALRSLSLLVTDELKQILALEPIPAPLFLNAQNYASTVDGILNQLVSQVNELSKSKGVSSENVEKMYADVARVMRERIETCVESASISRTVEAQKETIEQSTSTRLHYLRTQVKPQSAVAPADNSWWSTASGYSQASISYDDDDLLPDFES